MADDAHKSQGKNQGEGNRDAARQYNEATREFVEAGKVDEAARKAQRQDPTEARDAEAKGKARAKEEDPALARKRTGFKRLTENLG